MDQMSSMLISYCKISMIYACCQFLDSFDQSFLCIFEMCIQDITCVYTIYIIKYVFVQFLQLQELFSCDHQSNADELQTMIAVDICVKFSLLVMRFINIIISFFQWPYVVQKSFCMYFMMSGVNIECSYIIKRLVIKLCRIMIINVNMLVSNLFFINLNGLKLC